MEIVDLFVSGPILKGLLAYANKMSAKILNFGLDDINQSKFENATKCLK